MDKQHLSDRIMQIQAEMEATKANYAKLEGHLNECTHWLQTMVTAEMEKANPKPEDVNDNATMDGVEVEPNEQGDVVV